MNTLKIGLIGGTGLGEAVLQQTDGTPHELDTPFGRPSDVIVEARWEDAHVFVLSRHGPGHLKNPSQIPYRANIFALKQLGVTHILASGAVGSLREELHPRDLVVPDQLIDKTTRRDGTFFDNAAVHVEFAEPFCPVLRRILLEAAGLRGEPGEQATTPPAAGAPAPLGQPVPSESTPPPQAVEVRPAYTVHDRGCYVCMEGPAFSTRAESLMHRLWGGDLIGMTAMPEAKLAREAEIPYALIALVTDYDCWRQRKAPAGDAASKPDAAALLAEITGNLREATGNALDLMRRAVRRMASRPDELAACPAGDALRLAVWSDKNRIDPQEVQRLAPLWMRYFRDPSERPEG